MSTASKTHATGRIDVKTYEPQRYEEVGEGPNLIEIHVTETFSGDIEAKESPTSRRRCARTSRRASSGSSA